MENFLGITKVFKFFQVGGSLNWANAKIGCRVGNVIGEPLRKGCSIFLQDGSESVFLHSGRLNLYLTSAAHFWAWYKQAQNVSKAISAKFARTVLAEDANNSLRFV